MATWPYNTGRWQRLRKAKKAQQPTCQRCEALGKVRPATQIDHDVPISEGGDPFPSLDELNAFCISCHSQKTNEDMSGRVKGCDTTGLPLDPGHPWNKSVER